MRRRGSYFPEAIIEEILLNLPIKSLVRFTAVCKSWNSLIKSPSFIHTQLSRTTQSNNRNQTHLLLLERLENISLYWDKPSSFDICTTLKGPTASINTTAGSVSFSIGDFVISGTCKGLVFLVNYIFGVAIIWNPSVHKYVILPRFTLTTINKYNAYFAFGYDSHTNDYKVLRITGRGINGQKSEAEVWSLARGSWTILNSAFIPPSHWRSSFINGAFIWTSLSRGIILTFDISTESFGEMLMPEVFTRDYCIRISKYRESLALVHVPSNQDELHIWVMKEYGVADSWTRLSTVPWKQNCLGSHLCFRECGELVIVNVGGGHTYSVNPKSKEVKLVPYVRWVNRIYPFVESLVLLGEPNSCSY